MDRLWICLAIAAVGFATLWITEIDAAESEAQTPAVTRLERLKPSKLLLKPPQGLPGGFAVARTAPEVDFAVYPGQFAGARLWSSWGDVLAASDGRFYAAIGDHDAPHGTTFVYCVDPAQKTVTRVMECNQIVPAPPDKYSPGKIHAPLVEADDGAIYVFGYRGSVRKTGSETGYRGDWLLRYRPDTGRAESLGVPVPFSSVPVLEHCSTLGCLYGLSVPGLTMPEPQTQLFRYDLESGRVTFTCEVDAKGPRAVIVSRDGRVYFGGGDPSSGDPVLMRYEPRKDQVKKLAVRIPGDGMLRAASRADADGVAYGIALSDDGSQLFISFNGAQLPAGKQSEFGLCSALLLHIPESERSGR
jgi:sugar lactone lactonase YvrE